MKYLISKKIEDLLKSSGDKYTNKKLIDEGLISFDELKRIYELEISSRQRSLLYYLSTTTPQYEKPVVPKEKTKDYIKLMERLRTEQQEKEYRSYLNKDDVLPLIDSIGVYSYTTSKEDYNASNMGKEVKHQLTTILNILITTGSVGYAVWYWTGSSMRVSLVFRTLLSVFASILVLIAEVVIFGGYMRKVGEARLKERRKVEVREVIESHIFSGKGSISGPAGSSEGKVIRLRSSKAEKIASTSGAERHG